VPLFLKRQCDRTLGAQPLEFYFGTTLPTPDTITGDKIVDANGDPVQTDFNGDPVAEGASVMGVALGNQNAGAGAVPILDSATAYGAGEQGLDYGWLCDGSTTFSGPVIAGKPSGEGTAVDYTSGTRAPPREIYGLNHFDRHGACTSGVDHEGTDWGLRPVSWEVGLPDGFYEVQVDFAADSSNWDNCLADAQGDGALWSVQVEGEIGCYHKPGCMYQDVVAVEDGALTVTGYSHYAAGPTQDAADYGSCHSIAFVKIQRAAQNYASGARTTGEFYFGTAPPLCELTEDKSACSDGSDSTCTYASTACDFSGNCIGTCSSDSETNFIPSMTNADIAVSDDATAYAEGRDGGFAYGWDCDGSATFSGPDIAGKPSGDGTAVDYTSGQRAAPREVYGLNHFDRHGACVSGPDADGVDWGRRAVNWNVGVPNGMYQVDVDFGSDPTNWDNCATDWFGPAAEDFGYVMVEGVIACFHKPGCMYSDLVQVCRPLCPSHVWSAKCLK